MDKLCIICYFIWIKNDDDANESTLSAVAFVLCHHNSEAVEDTYGVKWIKNDMKWWRPCHAFTCIRLICHKMAPKEKGLLYINVKVTTTNWYFRQRRLHEEIKLNYSWRWICLRWRELCFLMTEIKLVHRRDDMFFTYEWHRISQRTKMNVDKILKSTFRRRFRCLWIMKRVQSWLFILYFDLLNSRGSEQKSRIYHRYEIATERKK